MAKQNSYKGKKQYAMYQNENRRFKNKVAKVKRHVKNHPEDTKAAEALEKGFAAYSKKKPGTKHTRSDLDKQRLDRFCKSVANIVKTNPTYFNPLGKKGK